MKPKNTGLIVSPQVTQPARIRQPHAPVYTPAPNNVIISYMTDPRTRIPNPLYPIRIVRTDLEPIVMIQSEPEYQSSPQVKFWLEKPAPTLRQLIKNWFNKK